MAIKRMALGKGLGALIPQFKQEESKTILFCGIEEIIPILAEREGCSQREITKRRIHEDALRLYIKVIKGGKI